jgi:hypothetical protein
MPADGGQFHHLRARFGVEQFQRCLMVKWCNHAVSIRVGIQVYHDEGALSAMHDHVFGIVFLLCQCIAKNAAIFLLVAFDIVPAPGCENSFHGAILAEKRESV